MSAATEFAELQKLQPKEAVALLQARGKLTTTYAWQDVWQAEHGVQVCAATMGKTLKRLGLTRKKRPFTPPSKSKAP